MGFMLVFDEYELGMDEAGNEKIDELWPDAIKGGKEERNTYTHERLTDGCRVVVGPEQSLFHIKDGKVMDVLVMGGAYIYHKELPSQPRLEAHAEQFELLYNQGVFPENIEIVFCNNDVEEDHEEEDFDEWAAGAEALDRVKEEDHEAEADEPLAVIETAEKAAEEVAEPQAPLFCPFCMVNLADYPKAENCIRCGKDLTGVWGIEYGIYRSRIKK